MALIYRTLSAIDVYADSGYWQDIQNAVDEVVYASGGAGGNVHIPAGQFNFVNVGESWTGTRVVAPPGVNFFGAPTERDAKGQVIAWKTVLVMPWEVPTSGPDDKPTWFGVSLTGSTDKSFRFSDIKLVGWRFYNNSSKTQYTGVAAFASEYTEYPTEGIQDMRVDHCNFQDLCGHAVSFATTEAEHNRRPVSGVIDHNRMVNTIGIPAPYEAITVGYGIIMRRWTCDVWEANAANVFGRYNNYTVVIEDNYFSKWRHCTSSNDGIHQIVRHNIFEGCYGYGEVDGHGSYADEGTRSYAVGTRAMEVYENIFKNPDTSWTTPGSWDSKSFAINIRGGSIIATNNTLIGYYALCDLNNDWGNYVPMAPQCFISQTYIWGNNLGGAYIIRYNSDNTENVNYFLRAPNLVQDGFTYTPYPYPHPLTVEVAPITPWTGQLEDGTYRITMPSQVQVGSDIYNFKQWEDGTTNPVRIVNLTADTMITATYQLAQPTMHNLTISTSTGGTTTPAPAVYSIAEGTQQQITAIPSTDYMFGHWELDGVIRTENPITVTMDADHSLTAAFQTLPPPPPQKQYLTIASVNGQTNPVAGTYEVDKNTTVTVTCTPNSSYRFKEWLLDNVSVSTSTSYAVLMDMNHGLVGVCEAIPPPPTYTLFISASIGGTTHPAIGTYEYMEGTVVNVAPIPDNGYRFANWTLDGQAITDNPINVTMNADHSLTAIFEALPPPPPGKQHLTIVAINGQTNPVAGTYELDNNSSLTVTATPNTGYIFKHWLFDNVIAGTDPTITVTMNIDHTLVAVCEAVSPTPTLWTWPFLTWLRNLIKKGRVTPAY
jgi:hypothetical protein